MADLHPTDPNYNEFKKIIEKLDQVLENQQKFLDLLTAFLNDFVKDALEFLVKELRR